MYSTGKVFERRWAHLVLLAACMLLSVALILSNLQGVNIVPRTLTTVSKSPPDETHVHPGLVAHEQHPGLHEAAVPQPAAASPVDEDQELEGGAAPVAETNEHAVPAQESEPVSAGEEDEAVVAAEAEPTMHDDAPAVPADGEPVVAEDTVPAAAQPSAAEPSTQEAAAESALASDSDAPAEGDVPEQAQTEGHSRASMVLPATNGLQDVPTLVPILKNGNAVADEVTHMSEEEAESPPFDVCMHECQWAVVYAEPERGLCRFSCISAFNMALVLTAIRPLP